MLERAEQELSDIRRELVRLRADEASLEGRVGHLRRTLREERAGAADEPLKTAIERIVVAADRCVRTSYVVDALADEGRGPQEPHIVSTMLGQLAKGSGPVTRGGRGLYGTAGVAAEDGATGPPIPGTP